MDGLTVRDSAGVRVVESLAPAWGEGEGWTLDPEPEVDIGSDPPAGGPPLFNVVGVLRLGAGRIVVGNAGTRELLWFDSLGTFLGASGGRGEGPGELMGLHGLYRCPGDTILVNEGLRVSEFDSEGRFVTSKRLAPRPGDRGSFSVHGVTEDCRAVLVESSQNSPPPRDRHHRLPSTLYWRDLETGGRDTLSVFTRYAVFGLFRNGLVLPWQVPWTGRTHWAIAGDLVYLGSSDEFEFRAFTRDGGLQKILRRAANRRPVTDVDRRMFAKRREELMAAHPQFRSIYVLPGLDDFPVVPDELPTHSGMLADDEGNLWVRDYPRTVAGWLWADLWDRAADPEVWTIFDRAGRWLGSLTIPPGVEVLAVEDDRVIGIRRDPYDVERVRILRLQKHGGR